MRISAVWHLAALVALAALMAMTGTAHSSEIADLYSSIDSADVTLEGDVAGMALQLDLMDEGRLIATRNLTLDGAGTFVIRWPALKAEKGSYDVCALLWGNGTLVSRKCNSFFYGGVEPIRFDVRDFVPTLAACTLSSVPAILPLWIFTTCSSTGTRQCMSPENR